jgi:hypothetical protein
MKMLLTLLLIEKSVISSHNEEYKLGNKYKISMRYDHFICK